MTDSMMQTKTKDKLRAKARWSILRHALLSGNNTASFISTPSSSSPNHDDNDSLGSVQQQHSMNTFPGFCVLERTILPPASPFLVATDGVGAAGEENDSRHILYTYKSCSSTSSPFYTELQFVTREAKELPAKSTIRDRIEGLFSHRIYNGVDNTGNVRVWDAEMTLAGFLLDMAVSKMDEEEDLCHVGDDYVDDRGETIELIQLRNQLRSIMLTACTTLIKDNASRTNSPSAETPEPVCNILELGAGQAGLAGLALMVASSNAFVANHGSGLSKMKPCRVIFTDGHPKCIMNNKICVDLTKKMIASKTSERTNVTTTTTNGTAIEVECNVLLWDSSPEGAKACRRMNNLVHPNTRLLPTPVGNSQDGMAVFEPTEESSKDEGLYHLCLASDCVHFQEFHDGIFTTIARTLAVGGIALLCQPKRGTSLSNFIKLIGAVNKDIGTEKDTVAAKLPLFEITLYEDFHPKVSGMHKALMLDCSNHVQDDSLLPSSSDSSEEKFIQSWSKSYDPNWHRPLLLVLRKLRFYEEDVDGELARQHVRKRVAGSYVKR